MKKVLTWDIDGTSANINHRLIHISNGKKDWKSFLANKHLDEPIEQTMWLNRVLAEREDVVNVFCTGRSEDEREETEAWLTAHGAVWEKLYMRASGDSRPDHVAKPEMIEQMRRDGYDPFIIFDDRPKVVQAFRDMGLFVLQCAYNEVETFKFHWTIRYPLTVLVGPSGSGKSTLVGNGSAVISSDQLRIDLTGDMADQSQNDRVFGTMRELAIARLRLGLPVIIDATNLKTKDRMAAAMIAPPSMPILYRVINRPLADKIRDGGWRNGVSIKGMTLIERHEQIFQANKKMILRGDDLPNVTVENLIKE